METVTHILQELLTSLGIEPYSIETEHIAGTTFLSVTAPIDLVGVSGDRIKAINMLVRKVVEKKGLDVRFTVDANGYYKAEVAQVEMLARTIAQEVITTQKDKEMLPMRAFDRLVAHAALTGMQHIRTESTGEGRDRRVVIKYTA